MIIWINGTFGAGKTTTCTELARLLEGTSAIYDTEFVGYLLRSPMLPIEPVEDFQQWPLWRSLVVEAGRQIRDYTGSSLLVPQTVLVEQYWNEIAAGFAKENIPVRHFCLHTDRDTLVSRIETDHVEAGASQWRLDHLDGYEQARSWLTDAASTIDTTEKSPHEVAKEIMSHLNGLS